MKVQNTREQIEIAKHEGLGLFVFGCTGDKNKVEISGPIEQSMCSPLWQVVLYAYRGEITREQLLSLVPKKELHNA